MNTNVIRFFYTIWKQKVVNSILCTCTCPLNSKQRLVILPASNIRTFKDLHCPVSRNFSFFEKDLFWRRRVQNAVLILGSKLVETSFKIDEMFVEQ